jgi:hypothetical protein
MAAEPTTPIALLDGKISVPSELRTAEWARVPQWVRERSFYLAGVQRAEILEGFRKEVRKITEGTASMAESERDLREMLDRVGYTPEPGQEGTIKDLRTSRRMQIALRTNVRLLQGWARKETGLSRGAQIAFPAWELVRFINKINKRDWQGRWRRAGGELTKDGRMIALKTDGIWLVLGSLFPDSLGVDYPPFAWGSGMGWEGVSRAEAKRLGILPDGWKPPEREPVGSPNENLSIVPKVTEPEIRSEMEDHLKGLAKWEGKRLIFTDPNGTRPFTGEQLAEVWGKGMPEMFQDMPAGGLLQQDALVRWLGDHEEFREQFGTDSWDDLLRLKGRIVSKPVERLWRGMAMPTEKLDDFLRGAVKTYTTRAEFPLESWTDSQAAAQTYARAGGKGWSVILEVSNPQGASDFSALARALANKVEKKPQPPLVTESEWVYATGRSFRVIRSKKDTETRTVHITLEELP